MGMFDGILRIFGKKEKPRRHIKRIETPYFYELQDEKEKNRKLEMQLSDMSSDNIKMRDIIQNVKNQELGKEQAFNVQQEATNLVGMKESHDRKMLFPISSLDGKPLFGFAGHFLGYAYFAEKYGSIVLMVSNQKKKKGWPSNMFPLMEGRSFSDIIWNADFVTPESKILTAKYIHNLGKVDLPDEILIERIRVILESKDDISKMIVQYGGEIIKVGSKKEKKKEGDKEIEVVVGKIFYVEFPLDNYKFMRPKLTGNPIKVVEENIFNIQRNVMEVIHEQGKTIREQGSENQRWGMVYQDIVIENERLRNDRIVLKSANDSIKADNYDNQQILQNIIPENIKLRKENLDLATSTHLMKTLATTRKIESEELTVLVREMADKVGADQIDNLFVLIARLARFAIENQEGTDILLKFLGKKGTPEAFTKFVESKKLKKILEEMGK